MKVKIIAINMIVALKLETKKKTIIPNIIKDSNIKIKNASKYFLNTEISVCMFLYLIALFCTKNSRKF